MGGLEVCVASIFQVYSVYLPWKSAIEILTLPGFEYWPLAPVGNTELPQAGVFY